MTYHETDAAIHDRPVFGRMLFAQCWEDPVMDMEALRVGPGKTLLSVTSGGCNTLSLATLEPQRIIAVDLNPVQSWLLELKIAGIQTLDHGEYLELLGVRTSPRRPQLYRHTRPQLSDPARRYWDGRPRDLAHGVLRAGRYERYLSAFRQLLRGIQGSRRIERLFAERSTEERRRFYDDEWDRRAWRLFFRLFFSRGVLGRAGLDPAFFTYVNGIESFGTHFRGLAEHALVDLPIIDNYFIAQICLGRYLDETHVPPYLERDRFEALRRTVDRIEVVTGELLSVLREQRTDSIDAFNFSNVFEWVPQDVYEAMLVETHRVARSDARLSYRNLLVRRSHPESMNDRFTPHRALADQLLRQDRSFVYSNFEVAGVRKPAGCGAM